MKLPHALLVALLPILIATAQEAPPAPTPAPEVPAPAPAAPAPAPVPEAPPPAPTPVVPTPPPVTPALPSPQAAPDATPAVTVKPAMPAVAAPTFTEAEVLKRETALKKQTMMIGMGAGVLGILIGMMIGRKTAPRVVTRRY